MRAILAAILLLTASTAQAHDAPSGWAYEAACCSNMDCGPVPSEQVQDLGGGRYRYGGLTFEGSAIRPSRDSKFHACIQVVPGMPRRPLCLYVVQGS